MLYPKIGVQDAGRWDEAEHNILQGLAKFD
jgi:hypothetical protein